MQYFVVFEDAKKFRWQIELLYESAKILDLTDRLLIAICPDKNSVVKHKYSNIVYFKNSGSSYFNRCYALRKALKLGLLKQPFVLLEANSFLVSEIPLHPSPISGSYQEWLDWDVAKNDIKDIMTGNWVDIGGTCVFNKLPSKVFEDMIKYTRLNSRYGLNLSLSNNNVDFERVAYETPLTDRKTKYVVNYEKGIFPFLPNNDVYNSINFSFKTPLPFKMILETPINGNPNMAILKMLTHSWLTSNSAETYFYL